MADFDRAYRHTMGAEGGYAHHAADRGGETYKGIARNHHPGWPGWVIIDQLKAAPGFPFSLDRDADLQRSVRAFYRREFWDALRLDEVKDQAIAGEIFDNAVNMGVATAARMAQEAVNLLNRGGLDYADIAVDGRIGPVTIARLNGHPYKADLYKTINLLQGERYIRICRADPTQEVFFRGWLGRVNIERLAY